MTRSTHLGADNERSIASVVAVVVTFDAPEALHECVHALQAQTAPVREIIVVDNGNADSSVLRGEHGETSDTVRMLHLPENTGPAGAFARGLREALSSDPDFVWVMDDDVVPAPECLQLLVREMRDLGDHAVLFPSQINTRTGSNVEHWGWCAALIPASAVRRVGVPLAEFFWGMEDTEYFRDRLPLAGYPLRRVAAANVRLPIRDADARRPAWKYYYECRNRTYFYLYRRAHIPATTRLKSLGYRLVGELNRVRRVEDEKLRKTWAICLGVLHGLTKRLGRRVETDSADRAWSRDPPLGPTTSGSQ